MAISEAYTGTKAVDTTEWSLTSNDAYDTSDAVTDDGVYQLFLDLSDMTTGDILQIRWYEKVRSGDTQRCFSETVLSQTQSCANWVSPAFILLHGWTCSLDALAGTITVLWSIRRVA